MKEKEFAFRIASDTSREKVFVEVFYGGEQLGEISQEGPEPVLILFPPTEAKYWEFPLQTVLAAFQEAKRGLLGE